MTASYFAPNKGFCDEAFIERFAQGDLVAQAPLLALVPLATIAVSVWVALRLMALLTLLPGIHLVNVSKVFAVVMLYGAGTDYCLFLISRYREELARGREPSSTDQSEPNRMGSVHESRRPSARTV